MTRSIVLACVLLLCACGRQGQSPAAAAGAGVPASAPLVTLLMTDGSAGPITPATPFDQAVVAALFPGATVDLVPMIQGDQLRPTLTILAADMTPLFEVHAAADGKTVGSVDVLGGDIRGPAGERIGAAYDTLAFRAGECATGEGRYIGQVVCSRSDAPHLQYVIGLRDWRETTMPSRAKLSADGALRGYHWSAS